MSMQLGLAGCYTALTRTKRPKQVSAVCISRLSILLIPHGYTRSANNGNTNIILGTNCHLKAESSSYYDRDQLTPGS